ncbi:MAG: ABC transporter permease [Verrucomicrobia bacterium]|nr:ABC transporter permease [Verrucomicrobiota bacterium]
MPDVAPLEKSALANVLQDKAVDNLSRRFWRRFRRHQLAIGSGVVLTIILLLTFAAPLLAPRGPFKIDVASRYKSPSSQFWLGTDRLGRDVWSRVLYGGQVSLSVSLVITAITFSVGIVLGTISGYAGGSVDIILQRIMEIFSALPSLIIVITIGAILGSPNIYLTMLVFGFLGWGGVYRFVRGQILTIREEDFVWAAHSVGARATHIILRHVLPNVVPYLTVQLAFFLPGAILTETSLSFLGLGVQEPTPSWGNVVGTVRSLDNLEQRPWMWLPAGILITLTMLSINFIADAMRDALDPRVVLDN